MARSPLILALLAALALPAPFAHAEEPRFHASGDYLVGHPGTTRADACGLPNRATDDVDSKCVALPAGLVGLPYVLVARDSTGVLVGVEACFYQERAFLSCGTSTVPPGANFFSVSSISGVGVAWTFTIE